jgi:predicted ATPase
MVASDDNKTRDWIPVMAVKTTTSLTSHTDCKSDNSFSINWSKWKLCGREAEIQQLEECYLTRKEKGLVLVTGPLGIGKTVLTECLQRRIREDAGILVRGSFHSSQTEPYVAFVEAFTDLVVQLRRKNDYEVIRSDIRKAIAQSGAEWFLVSDGLAILKTLMQDDDDDVVVSSGHRATTDSTVLLNESERQRQQQVEIRQQSITALDRESRFVRAVTKVVEAIGAVFPLAIVLDNLMWADLGSLLLLESLCLTGKLSNVLLVATCRGEEVGFHDPLSVKLRSLEDRGIALTDVRVPPLSVDDIFELLLALSDRNINDLPYQHQLASNIHKCTDGVPLLIRELLGVLQKEGTQSILLREHLSYDDFINAKIRQAQSCRHALQLMACIGGGTMHLSVLCELLHETEDETRNNLLAAQEQGLITVCCDGTEYAFKHGNIQAFVYNVMSAIERITFHYSIATRLHDWLSEAQIQDNIFLLVDQYIQANELIPPMKKENVARLCLVAAQKASTCAAFSSAEIYVRFGLSLLTPRSKWRDSYGLTLALMNATIELEFSHGNHDKVDAVHKEIILHSRTPVDAIDSYAIHLSSLGSRGKTNEAVVDALPRNFLGLRIVAGRFRIKRIMKDTTDEDMLSLPPLSDAKIAAILKIMSLMFVYVYMKQSPLTAITAMRCIDLTCRYGLHPMSEYAFECDAIESIEELTFIFVFVSLR